MTQRGLTQREQEHLAVLRVMVMRADPESARIEVRRVDVAAAIATLDRLAQAPLAETLQVSVFHGPMTAGICVAGTATIHTASPVGSGTGEEPVTR